MGKVLAINKNHANNLRELSLDRARESKIFKIKTNWAPGMAENCEEKDILSYSICKYSSFSYNYVPE